MTTKKPMPMASATEPFPFTVSINEPQTVSLPPPQDYEPPPQNGKAAHKTTAAHGHGHHDADPDDLEGEIEEAVDDGDVKPGKKGKRR